jgi:hypothetical protein
MGEGGGRGLVLIPAGYTGIDGLTTRPLEPGTLLGKQRSTYLDRPKCLKVLWNRHTRC